MQNLSIKKSLTKFVIVLATLLICIFIEIFFFNAKYFTIPKDERGLIQVNKNDLILHNMKLEGEKFVIVGSKPYFQIPGNKYISFIKLNLSPSTNNFGIYWANSKTGVATTTNIGLKNYAFIAVNAKVNNAKFYINVDKVVKSISIDSVVIDNRFTFNIIRFLIILSVLIVVLFFIFFKQLSKQKLHINFLVLVLTLGTIISLSIPPYYAYDEREHFIKSYQTASFDPGFSHGKPINWVSNINVFFNFNHYYNVDNSYKERLEFTKTFFTKDYSSTKKFYTSTAQTYLFVPYIPSSIGIFLGKLFKLPFILTFYLGRFFSLLIYAILGSLIIKKVKIAKRLIFMILLLPGVVFTAVSYSVDPLTNIFALAAVSIFINMLCAEDGFINYKMILGFTASVAITTMCKVTYAPLCILIFAIPISKFKHNKKIPNLLMRLSTLIITGLIAAITYAFASSNNMNQWAMPGVNVHGQILYIVHNFPTFIHTVYNFVAGSIMSYFSYPATALAYFGSLDPIWFLTILISLFTIAITDNESDILSLKISSKVFILLSVGLSWGLVISALYLTFTPVGSADILGVQGRYFAPLLLPFFLLFKNDKILYKFKEENLNYIISIGSSSLLLMTAIKIFLQCNN
ncbi:DUF2142 domain-containing protein [Clostridium akagii]|uniref:DUF2142 domain-containing protein n=1 Tax=Clostridium akagii TaxID=91623 RepID=UPI00047ABBD2|nr:DUF2142 domain-containing protein [Clostridium akagii]